MNLHSTVVDDAARNNMIIVHHKPPHLLFILDREWCRSQLAARRARVLTDGRVNVSIVTTLRGHLSLFIES
jgi:hypothetical protein